MTVCQSKYVSKEPKHFKSTGALDEGKRIVLLFRLGDRWRGCRFILGRFRRLRDQCLVTKMNNFLNEHLQTKAIESR